VKSIFQFTLLFGLIPQGAVLAEETSITVVNEAFGNELTTEVVYAQGTVVKDDATVDRDLLMDVYKPVGQDLEGPFPAVILVHGGSYQIGG